MLGKVKLEDLETHILGVIDADCNTFCSLKELGECMVDCMGSCETQDAGNCPVRGDD